ncbi:acyl carrier protein [Entomoplasma ellychniae]|uniref:Acyl carrier protein n=1 Tax=Entomoplasma ellychniae TaxID=2114 RepID=A0A8E2QW08_9MOLU|nr:acyl carrier protein [Entomoplasma ellychniae]PPE04717.1 acyl carrier protein [Entomoplasma ellychniae]
MNINNEILKEIKKRGVKVALTKNTKFLAMGLDSLDLMDMITVLEEKLNVYVSDDILLSIKTIGDLEIEIEKLLKNA